MNFPFTIFKFFFGNNFDFLWIESLLFFFQYFLKYFHSQGFFVCKNLFFLLNDFLPQVFPTSCLYSPTAKWKTSQIYRKFVSDSQILFRSADNVLVCVCVFGHSHMSICEQFFLALQGGRSYHLISSIPTLSYVNKRPYILVVFVQWDDLNFMHCVLYILHLMRSIDRSTSPLIYRTQGDDYALFLLLLS